MNHLLGIDSDKKSSLYQKLMVKGKSTIKLLVDFLVLSLDSKFSGNPGFDILILFWISKDFEGRKMSNDIKLLLARRLEESGEKARLMEHLR